MIRAHSDKLKVEQLDRKTLLRALKNAEQCGFEKLERRILKYFEKSLRAHNACEMFDKAIKMNLKTLAHLCANLMDLRAETILRSEGLSSLSAGALCYILHRDQFCATEIDIFRGVQRWLAAKTRDVESQERVLKVVRLPLISTMDLLDIVLKSNLFTEEEILNAIEKKEWLVADREERLALVKEEGFPTFVQREVHVSSSTFRYRWRPGDNMRFSVELSGPSIMSHFEFSFYEDRPKLRSYFVEVSLNFEDWQRIVDTSGHLCGSHQEHFIEPVMVHYIRVAHGQPPVALRVQDFRASYSAERIERRNGLYVPDENMALENRGAKVIHCCGGNNGMIRGNSEWTWHKIGFGSIIIQFPQPYIVDSLSFRLKNDNEQSYSYHVEITANGDKWLRVAETKKLVSADEEQRTSFEPVPVVFIKLVGIAATNAEDLSCTDFKCPAPKTDLPITLDLM